MTQTYTNLPHCVGFIMDGNRRWANEQQLSSLDGHVAGKDVFRETVGWVREQHIPHAVYFAFSTENWRRSEAEVESLLELFMVMLTTMLSEVHENKVRVRVIGERQSFSIELQKRIAELETVSEEYEGLTIWIALSYGGRAEILAATNAAIAAGQAVDEATFVQYMWSADMPDPDLIIRTGGEQRLSNFLPWQSVYTELIFTDTYWPAFTKAEFMRMLHIYEQRQRRQGR